MDLEKLKELAQAATPGPCLDPGASFHDARYIAAANPQTMLELIAEVERLREANDMLRKEVERRLDQERQLPHLPLVATICENLWK